MNWYLKVVKEHYADFSGRARRKEFWMFVLFNFIISVVISIIFTGLALATESPALAAIAYVYSLAVLIPGIAVSVRRLHDIGKSGWFLLIALIPIVGPIWLLVLQCTDSVNGENKWGENPKGIGNNSTINEIGKE